MLKGNLSTRPFYNERLATLAIALVALVAALLTAYNATELIRLSSERRTTQAGIDHDQAEVTRIRMKAGTLQQSVDRALLARLAGSTREANDIIDQRTFSWTAFFKLIEKTLPIDARLVMVSPQVEKGTFRVSIDIVGKTIADVAAFTGALRDTGAFYNVAATTQQRNDDGTISATIDAAYRSSAVATTPKPAPPATTGRKP